LDSSRFLTSLKLNTLILFIKTPSRLSFYSIVIRLLISLIVRENN